MTFQRFDFRRDGGDIVVIDPRRLANKVPQALHHQLERREVQDLYGRECRLANRIVRGEEIRARLSWLQWSLEDNLHDLWQASRLADRINLCQDRLELDKEEIRQLWLDLYMEVGRRSLAGEEIAPLDAFFFWAYPYREDIVAQRLSYAELDAGYDWEAGVFRPEFRAARREG